MAFSGVFSRLRDDIKMATQKEYLGWDKGICVKQMRNRTEHVNCGHSGKSLMWESTYFKIPATRE